MAHPHTIFERLDSIKDRAVLITGAVIFAIRWILAPMYLAFYVVMGVYLWKFLENVWEIFSEINTLTNQGIMLIILELIDMSMIANLVVMTTIGGYAIFVKQFNVAKLEDKPRWLNADFSSTEQKIKLGMSLIGIAAVNLMNLSVKASSVSWDVILKQGFIIGVFLVLTLGYAYINLIIHPKGNHAPAATPDTHINSSH